MDDVILVTGANSLLGQHVIKHLQLYWENLAKIKTFDLQSPFVDRLPDYCCRKVSLETFQGSIFDESLMERVVDGVTTVIHLLEVQNFTVFPDLERMSDINIKGTGILLSMAEKQGVHRFIYGSSMFIMMSKYFPSVYNPETAPIPVESEQLFPEYSKTKIEAERLVENSTVQSFIVRLSLSYGEADEESEIYRAVRTAKAHNGTLPALGDNRGVIQYTYAGNIAWGIVHILRLMISDASLTNEVVFLVDETPYKGFYSLVTPFLKGAGCELSEVKYPWLLTYWTWWSAEIALKFLSKFVDVRRRFVCFPSAAFLMAHYHYWYFFSGVKARTFLDYVPLYPHKKVVTNCEAYYANI